MDNTYLEFIMLATVTISFHTLVSGRVLSLLFTKKSRNLGSHWLAQGEGRIQTRLLSLIQSCFQGSTDFSATRKGCWEG